METVLRLALLIASISVISGQLPFYLAPGSTGIAPINNPRPGSNNIGLSPNDIGSNRIGSGFIGFNPIHTEATNPNQNHLNTVNSGNIGSDSQSQDRVGPNLINSHSIGPSIVSPSTLRSDRFSLQRIGSNVSPINAEPREPTASNEIRQTVNRLETLTSDILNLGDNTIENVVAKLVRLIFHDCVGGCDGCIDFTNKHNNGLQQIYNIAIDTQEKVPQLSKADVIAFMGIKAIERAVQTAGGRIQIQFLYGRDDCIGEPPKRNLPAAGETDGVTRIRNEFNVNDKEAVALLGCHTLGKCHGEVSGYEGPWDTSEKSGDNAYFLNLMTDGWSSRELHNEHVDSTQWIRDGLMMLNQDMILFKNFQLLDSNGTPSCQFSSCPSGNLAHVVTEYAHNMDSFHRNLETAFFKMSTKVSANQRRRLSPV